MSLAAVTQERKEKYSRELNTHPSIHTHTHILTVRSGGCSFGKFFRKEKERWKRKAIQGDREHCRFKWLEPGCYPAVSRPLGCFKVASRNQKKQD